MPIKPKQLILNLLLAAKQPVSSQRLIASCDLFDISSNNARGTLARLTADGLLQQVSPHGHYQLGSKAMDLASELSRWCDLEQRVCPWHGDWIGVFIGALGRTDRTALGHRVQVLKLAGFEELERGLFIHPNNLVGGLSRVRQRLYQLGLETEALVFQMDEMGAAVHEQAMKLWDIEALRQRYISGWLDMKQWVDTAKRLDIEEATRQSFIMGETILRNITNDPLLPAEMIDTQLRVRYVRTMLEHERVSHAYFEKLYRRLNID